MQYIKQNTELYHHGILGQKWGVRNGPPYPLKPGDHSAAEKKAGYTKSISGGSNPNQENGTSYGGVRKHNRVIKDYSDTSYTINNSKYPVPSNLPQKKKPMTIDEDCEAVNPKYSKWALTSNYTMNCTNCVMTYSLRRMGLDVEAQPLATGRQLRYMNDYFKDCVNEKKCSVVNFTPAKDTASTVRKGLTEECNKLCPDETGVGFLAIKGPYMCHVFSWEKTSNGKIVFLDPQSNHVDDPVIERYFTMVSKGKHLDPAALIARLDNCEVNSENIKDICKNH